MPNDWGRGTSFELLPSSHWLTKPTMVTNRTQEQISIASGSAAYATRSTAIMNSRSSRLEFVMWRRRWCNHGSSDFATHLMCSIHKYVCASLVAHKQARRPGWNVILSEETKIIISKRDGEDARARPTKPIGTELSIDGCSDHPFGCTNVIRRHNTAVPDEAKLKWIKLK